MRAGCAGAERARDASRPGQRSGAPAARRGVHVGRPCSARRRRDAHARPSARRVDRQRCGRPNTRAISRFTDEVQTGRRRRSGLEFSPRRGRPEQQIRSRSVTPGLFPRAWSSRAAQAGSTCPRAPGLRPRARRVGGVHIALRRTRSGPELGRSPARGVASRPPSAARATPPPAGSWRAPGSTALEKGVDIPGRGAAGGTDHMSTPRFTSSDDGGELHEFGRRATRDAHR